MKTLRPYKDYFIELAFKIPWIFIGAMMAAVSLEVILIPHGLIDGGITGVSMMLSSIGGFPLSTLLFLLNIPFLLLGLKFLGKRFAFSATFGIVALTISTGLLERKTPFLEGNTILILIIGGILLGMGIGIVIRNGGVLDGTDVLALLISSRTRLSVGEAIFVINIFIFLLALLLFGWKGALISTITYFIAVTVVDMVKS
ncbi:YitT family protein [Ureibacillus manganicus]|uniref:YitT family protein n=1 Tax=Ureibacillus manganicus TaxID=1266064 RepID=UPI0006925329|nr:YitT family protein [Ureibacillus manganicus]